MPKRLSQVIKAFLICLLVLMIPLQINTETPDDLVPVSSADTVTIYEQTVVVHIHTFSVSVLMESNGTFIGTANENYTVTSDGTYLTIHCFRDDWSSGFAVGNNIVAVRLDGVPDIPEDLWASLIVDYTLGYNGIAESRFNALGTDTQIGPYAPTPERGLCTYMGDQHSELVLGFVHTPAPVQACIYIRANGSVEPDTAPISSIDNITYTLTDNIFADVPQGSSAIDVQRDNIQIDGSGYTLQGTGTGWGISLFNRSNVTIKNTQITSFWQGIRLESSNNTVVSENSITNTYCGIGLYSYSSGNNLSRNVITNNNNGIELGTWSHANTISDNAISNNLLHGILVGWANYNVIYHNNFISNSWQAAFPSDQYPNTWDDGFPSGGNYWSNYQERYPNATEINDSDIWNTPYVIDEQNPDENNQDNYPLVNPWPLALIHDVAVTNIFPFETRVYEGDIANINVTVRNEGAVSETFNVSTSYDANIFQTQNNVTLDPDEETTLTFTWNTSGVPGNHRISAEASSVTGETDTLDNILVNGILEVITKVQEPVNGENATIEGNVTISNANVQKNALHLDASGPSGSTGWINVTFPMVNTTEIKVFINKEKLTPPPFPIITTNGTHYFIYFEFALSTHNITIQYAILGDINGDGIVDVNDLARIGKAYGTTSYSSTWDENCDITGAVEDPLGSGFFPPDGIVDIYDLAVCGENYGKS